MNIWILNGESGIKLFYKSFSDIDTDEDIVSGFLTAFRHFSMEAFRQELESIEMVGLRWIYTLEPNYDLLLIAAAEKSINTEILRGRLNVIKTAFIKDYKEVWKKRGKSWDGKLDVFQSFRGKLENFYEQWKEVENLAPVADLLNVLGIFQQLFIMLRNIIERRMYSKSRNEILDKVDSAYNKIIQNELYRESCDINNVTFTKDTWVNILDINLIHCDKIIILDFLKEILKEIVYILKDVKGENLCYKYFNQEKVFFYILNNISLLRDLELDKFLLSLFLMQ